MQRDVCMDMCIHLANVVGPGLIRAAAMRLGLTRAAEVGPGLIRADLEYREGGLERFRKANLEARQHRACLPHRTSTHIDMGIDTCVGTMHADMRVARHRCKLEAVPTSTASSILVQYASRKTHAPKN